MTIAAAASRWAAVHGTNHARPRPPAPQAPVMSADDGTSHREGRGQPRRADAETVRDRSVLVRPFPPSRRLVTAAVRAGRRIMPMHGLFDVDITTARQPARRGTTHRCRSPRSSSRRSAGQPPPTRRYTPTATGVAGWSNTAHVDVQTLIEVPTERRTVRARPHRPRRRHPQRRRNQRRDTGGQDRPDHHHDGRLLTTLAPALGSPRPVPG